jgi:hypothetical protein
MTAIVGCMTHTTLRHWRHWLIRSRWRRWLLPLLCVLPYAGSLLWLLLQGQAWVAQVMLAPLLMAAALSGLTAWLARQEFRRHWRAR